MKSFACALAALTLTLTVGCGPDKGTTQLPASNEVTPTLTTDASESTGGAPAAGGSATLSQ